jgi:hypothetical protein
MATPLRGKVESALVSYLGAASLPTENIFAGMASGDKTAPCVICKAQSAEEDTMGSGNFRVTCRIVAKGLAADGLTAFDTLCDAVRSAIGVNDLHAQLAAAVDGFTVWGTSANTKVEWDTDEDCWTESMEVEIYCAATDFV